jgi:hypothetical protein
MANPELVRSSRSMPGLARRSDRQGAAKSVRSLTPDLSDEWSELVDVLAGLVWSDAGAGHVNARVTEQVFRLAWLRLADHFTELPTRAVEAWLQQAVIREHIRLARLRRGHLRRVIAPSAHNATPAGA